MTTKLMVIAGFVVAFAAGVVSGLAGRDAFLSTPTKAGTNQKTNATEMSAVAPHAASGPSTRQDRRRGFLATELSLTSQQQELLDKIWSETARRGGREREDRRRQIRQERDDAIAALVPASQKSDYQNALQTYSQRMEDLDKEWRTSFQNAVEQTKQILTPEQRTKYEAMLKRDQERGPRGGPGGPERGERSGGRFGFASTGPGDHDTNNRPPGSSATSRSSGG